MKNFPNLLSTCDFPPFFEDDDDDDQEYEDDDEAVDVDGMFPKSGITSDSSHRCARTWQMPSSTSGLRLRKPVNVHRLVVVVMETSFPYLSLSLPLSRSHACINS